MNKMTAAWASKSQVSSSFVEISGGDIYWIEARPLEEGRYTLMRFNGKIEEMIPSPYDVQSRIHEYGGKPYVLGNEGIYFVNFKDQILYFKKDNIIKPVTDGSMRLAEPLLAKEGIIAVGEKGDNNFLVCVDPATGKIEILSAGQDFYAFPVLSPNGKKLAWIAWDHPNMPWDGTMLWVGDFIEGKLQNPICLAGGDSESILQPQWSEEGVLHYISDKTGWWNLYRYGTSHSEPICPMNAEFGMPLWVLGMSTYGFDGNTVIGSYQKDGQWKLIKIPLIGEAEILPFKFSQIHSVSVKNGIAAFVAGFSTEYAKVMRLNLVSQEATVMGDCISNSVQDFISQGAPLAFQSRKGHTVHAFYYPAHGFKKTQHPLLVKVHGGPTAQSTTSYNGEIQYWTSQGFAVIDVNYAGSSGYGREYRNLLKKQWGVFDWQDCEDAALHLMNQGLVDPGKIFIKGSSSGGYTALCALTFGSIFTCGASYYGISDLSLLAKETHKFESRYMDGLIGPYSSSKRVYELRSPLQQADLLNRPVIFFQGEDDKVVPPTQSIALYEILMKKGIKTELVLYKGEQHGFCNAKTIQNSLEREISFYRQSF